jgi:hypothetical protein
MRSVPAISVTQFSQRDDHLLDLASEWTGSWHEAFANGTLVELKRDSAAYFRMQGPTVIIEYAPQSVGGDPTKHISHDLCDPTNNYGQSG